MSLSSVTTQYIGADEMPSIFLSHSHSDKAFARKLAADLRGRGYVVWIDEAEIKIGDSLVQKIRDGIDLVDFVAAILSKASIESEWVKRELDMASNREIEERRVVVLPLLVEDVELPGFLKGKFYGDFRSVETYDAGLQRLLEAIGPAEAHAEISEDELLRLQEELEVARATAKRHQAEAERAGHAAFRAKSEKLRSAILHANKEFPLHAPINTAYAFELGDVPVTLDYLLWCIAKAHQRGVPHQAELLITLENKWDEANSMLEAYGDMLESWK